jgi:predicted transposase YdaD
VTDADPPIPLDHQAAELVDLHAEGRRTGHWSRFAPTVQQRRAAGVSVGAIADAVGVDVRTVYRIVRDLS